MYELFLNLSLISKPENNQGIMVIFSFFLSLKEREQDDATRVAFYEAPSLGSPPVSDSGAIARGV